MNDRLPRKFATVVYADIAECSWLTGDDEDATYRALTEYLDLVSITIQSHRGEVMHYAGDKVVFKSTKTGAGHRWFISLINSPLIPIDIS